MDQPNEKSADNHKKPPPSVIVTVLFVVLSAYFALVAAPYLAAQNQVDRGYTLRYKVFIVDFDGSTLGQSFTNFFTNIVPLKVEAVAQKLTVSPALPQLEVITASSVSDLRQMVSDQKALAAVFVSSGATSRFLNVTNSNCATVGSYNAESAMGLIIDEGRGQNPTNRVAGQFNGFLGAYSTYISANLLGNELNGVPFTTGQVTACIQNRGAEFLSNPVDYIVYNNSPTQIAPVMNNAMTIGNILVAVFASLYIVMGILKGLGPLEDYSPFGRMLARIIAAVIVSFGVAVTYATMCVGFSATGSGAYLYSGQIWGQFMAVQWCHCLLWIFGMMSLAIAVSPDIIGLPFGFLLVSNIIGGFGVDFAYPSYVNFYQIFPFNWSIQLLRHSAYGAYSSFVGQAAGILVAETLFFFFLFVYVSLRQPKGTSSSNDQVLTKNAQADAYSSVPAKQVAAGDDL